MPSAASRTFKKASICSPLGYSAAADPEAREAELNLDRLRMLRQHADKLLDLHLFAGGCTFGDPVFVEGTDERPGFWESVFIDQGDA